MRKTLIACVATALLVGGGTATASKLMTGKDIEDGSITRADLKKGTVSMNRLTKSVRNQLDEAGTPGANGQTGAAGPQGPTGAAGAKGEKGATGPAGAKGKSAFDTVPAGTSIRGVVGLDIHATSGGDEWGTLQSMAMPGSAVLDDDDVFVNVTHAKDLAGAPVTLTRADEDAGCDGTPAEPTAPAGKVCIYVLHAENVDDLFGYGVGSDQGFKLNFTNLDTGDAFVDATWAYTGA